MQGLRMFGNNAPSQNESAIKIILVGNVRDHILPIMKKFFPNNTFASILLPDNYYAGYVSNPRLRVNFWYLQNMRSSLLPLLLDNNSTSLVLLCPKDDAELNAMMAHVNMSNVLESHTPVYLIEHTGNEIDITMEARQRHHLVNKIVVGSGSQQISSLDMLYNHCLRQEQSNEIGDTVSLTGSALSYVSR